MAFDDPLIEEEELRALFRSVSPPAPSADFTARTMEAVRRQPLPPGRRALRNALAGMLSWAALIAGVTVGATALAANVPQLASAFSVLVSRGIGVTVWLMQFAGAGGALADVLSTTGFAVARAVVTKEGSGGLVLIVAVGALSLSMLQRLLTSQGSERGVSQWQEL
jgi:hypothetical protein